MTVIKGHASSLFLFLLAICLTILSYSRNFDEQVKIGAPVLTGFEMAGQSSYVASASAGEHMYAAWISLEPTSYYRIDFDIPSVADRPVLLTADLYNVGYDNPEQEQSFQLTLPANGKHFQFLINSGQSPPTAVLRFFYSGSGGLELAHPHLVRVPWWIVWSAPFGELLGVLLVAAHALRWLHRAMQRENKPLLERAGIGMLWVCYLAVVVVHVVVYLFTPFWGGDEYVYKSIAQGIWNFGRYGVLTRAMVGQSVDFPNLLYLWLIAPAFAAGADFYVAIRILNALVMTAVMFPVYWLARQLVSIRWALFVAALSALLPFANLGAFAVTEVLFYPLLIVAFCCAYQALTTRHWRAYVWYGVLVGVLLNVRLNALVLLPVLIVAQLWLTIVRGEIERFFRRPVWVMAGFSALLAYVGVQWLTQVAHIGGLGFYNLSEQTASAGQSAVGLSIWPVVRLLAGHMATMALQYALPLALLCVALVKPKRLEHELDNKEYVFFVLTMLTLLALVALSILFTIKVSGFDLGGLRRWHSRYYFYAYPLIILAGLVCIRMPATKISSIGVVALVVAQLLVASIFLLRLTPDDRWFGYIADNADMSWYRVFGFWAFVVSALDLVLLVLWLRCSNWVAAFFTLLLCVQTGVANVGWLKMMNYGQTHRGESCGVWVDSFFSQYPGRYAVFADSRPALVDVTFWLPIAPEYVSILSLDQTVTQVLPKSPPIRYVVTNGLVKVPVSWTPLSILGQCRIYPAPDWPH